MDNQNLIIGIDQTIGLTVDPATMSFSTPGSAFKSPYMFGHLAFLASLSAWLASRCSALAYFYLF
jgi:hypothetical protein